MRKLNRFSLFKGSLENWVTLPFDYLSHHSNGKVIGAGIPASICCGVDALSLQKSWERERAIESYLVVCLEENCVITCSNASPRGQTRAASSIHTDIHLLPCYDDTMSYSAEQQITKIQVIDPTNIGFIVLCI